MNSAYLRPAIAMIELIFAIVIMGIVLMSAPMLISTSTQGTTIGMQQEGINEAASKVNMILSYAWDENNTDDNIIPPLLHVTSGNSLFNPVAKDNRTRIGIPRNSSRIFYPDLNASSTLASDSGEDASSYDDVDDYNGESLTTLISIESATTDYVESATVKIDTTVNYGEDNYTNGSDTYSYVPFVSKTGTTNIKNIEVKLTSTDTANADILEKTIVLRAFSCNIGGIKYAEKWF